MSAMCYDECYMCYERIQEAVMDASGSWRQERCFWQGNPHRYQTDFFHLWRALLKGTLQTSFSLFIFKRLKQSFITTHYYYLFKPVWQNPLQQLPRKKTEYCNV